MYSHIFCGTLENPIQDSKQKDDDFGVKLYKIQLLNFQELVPDFETSLSVSELSRAQRYHFVKDKNRFIICRSLLKLLLAEHVSLDVDNIVLDVDANKKPFLPSHPSVFFNVSHAGDYAIIAIAKSPVGIDIEYINRGFDYKEILPTIFNKIEIDTINKSSDNHFTFYKFWTRKEAVVKAIGKGINDDFSKIPSMDGDHAVPLSILDAHKKVSVFSFHLNGDYVGALAFTEDISNYENIVFYPLPTSGQLKSLLFKR